MQSHIVRISEDGTLFLPDELREILKNTQELLVSWNERVIVLRRPTPNIPEEKLSKEDRIKRFFENADDLAVLNDVDPITEEEIQAEIAAYRADKRAHKLAGDGTL